ncbi:MAG: YfhO family protein [Bernardetiaceae bacterium]|nr:YfhO family protein [Bernardetiaceae bacterium]
MKNLNIKSLIPYIASIAIFYLLTFVYFSPEIIDGKSLRQDDMIKFQGMAAENREFLQETGEVSMWNGRMFSGMPAHLIYPQFDYGPLTIVKASLRGFFAEGSAAHLFFLPMVCMFIALLCFRVKPLLAALGGIAFALTTYNLILIDVGHVTKLWALSYAALILGGIHLVFRGLRWRGFALVALGMALELEAYHLQITYYLAFVCVIFAVVEAIYFFKAQEVRKLLLDGVVLLLAVALGISVNAGKLLTTLEYGKYSTRGTSELTPLSSERGQGKTGLDKQYAFDWSQGRAETLTLLIPKLYGGSSTERVGKGMESYRVLSGQYSAVQLQELTLPLYHGEQQFTSGPIYAGAIICFLFVLGLLILEPRYRYWLLAGFLLTMFFAWGKHLPAFNYTMFDYFPGFNKFRAVSMALSLSVLIMVLTAVLALEKLYRMEELDKTFLQKFAIALGLTGGFSLLVALFAGSISVTSPVDAQLGQLADFVHQDRQAMIRSSAFRSAFLIFVAAALLYFSLQKRLTKRIAFSVLGLLIVGDLFLVGTDYLGGHSFTQNPRASLIQKTAADERILSDKDLGFRVFYLPNPFNDSRISYYHRSVGGYFAAKMGRYQDLIERQLNIERQRMGEALQAGNPEFEKYQVLNMLNTRYIKVGEKAEQVIKNPAAFGTAWFASSVKAVQNPDEEMAALSNTDLRNTAIIDASRFELQKLEYEVDSAASVRMTDYKSNALTYEYESENDALIVFSEIYYPEGWKAEIDGKEVEILSANYVLRALEVPKGKHTIKFTFSSDSYNTGATITQISAYILLIVFGVLLVQVFLKSREKTAEQET